MAETRSDREDAADLAPFFAEARRRDAETEAPAVLMARIMADADEVRLAAMPRKEPRRPGVIEGMLSAFGGWRGATALAACAVAGVWVGLSGISETAAALVWSEDAGIAAEDPVAAFFDLAAAEI